MAGNVVAFKVDDAGSGGGDSRNVLVRGRAEEVTDPSQRAELDPLVPKSWVMQSGTDHLVGIPAAIITGSFRPPSNRALSRRGGSTARTSPTSPGSYVD